jgi:hypothetical protein
MQHQFSLEAAVPGLRARNSRNFGPCGRLKAKTPFATSVVDMGLTSSIRDQPQRRFAKKYCRMDTPVCKFYAAEASKRQVEGWKSASNRGIGKRE